MPLVTVAEVSGKPFHYVIIGGGTTGLVIATRLSEDPSVNVLVLEAGDAHLNDTMIVIPGQHLRQWNNPDYDWAFKTVEQKHANNRVLPWPRGKGLGGSSGMNFLLWNKPAKEYLNAFETLGNLGWNWENFDKYSKKAERFVKPEHYTDLLTYDMMHRGTEGPLVTSFPPVITHMENPVMKAMENCGIPRVADSSSGLTTGTTVVAATVDPTNHLRSYSANMYYVPNEGRQNLFVLTLAQVTSIVTKTNDDGTVTAIGVNFIYEETAHQVAVLNEVCLCAGAINSPQLLEISGIGNPAVLQKAGIEAKIHLNGVGENVQEHLYTGIAYELHTTVVDGNEVNTFDVLFDPEQLMKHFGMHASGQGVFNLATIGLTFLPLQAVSPNAETLKKSLEDLVMEGIKEKKWSAGLEKQYRVQLEHIEKNVASLEVILGPGLITPVGVPDATKRHITLGVGLNSPFSRGSIHVASRDSMTPPIIDPCVFEHAFDLQSMVELVKFNRRVAKTSPLKEFLKEEEVVPGLQVQTDDEIAEWLKTASGTTFHTVGSCSMLPRQDGGVVDNRLKVYGTSNIRVADLSIVPLHVGSHTQVLAYAIGEQAAEIIKGVI